MGFSIEIKKPLLGTPEQVDKMIQFLHLYKELEFGVSAPTIATASTLVKAPVPASTSTQTPEDKTIAQTPVEDKRVSRTVPFPVILTERQGIQTPPVGEQTADYIFRALQDHGSGLMLDELIKSMRQAGWSTTIEKIATIRGTINKTLRRNDKRFAQLPNGRWTLASPQPKSN